MHIFGEKRYSKRKTPPKNVHLDLHNPYVRGMNNCVFFNEGGGSTYRNLVDLFAYGYPSGTDSTWDKSRKYYGVTTTQNSYLGFGNGRYTRFANSSQPFTIRCIFKFNDLGRTSNTLFSKYGDSSGGAISPLEFSLRFNSSGNPISYNIGTTTCRLGAVSWIVPFQTNVIYDLFWIVNGNNINIYADGGNISVPTGTSVWKTLGGNSLGAYDAPGSTNPIILGADAIDSTKYSNNTYYLFQSWVNRALTLQEIRYLYNNPFSVIDQSKSNSILKNSLAAAAGYYNRRNGMLVGRSGSRTTFY